MKFWMLPLLSLGLIAASTSVSRADCPNGCQPECSPACQPGCPQVTYGYRSIHRYGWECRGNCEIRIPICIDSTCDMYQHHAYYPECHGHYYFRPYNWEHYSRDMAFLLGVGQVAPYSEDGQAELKPTTVPEQPLIQTRRVKLPNLEELMKKPTPALPLPVLPPLPKLD